MPALYLATGRTAGEECSSTYEGRHITLEESYLIHPTHADAFVDHGDPVIDTDGQNIVGVAFVSAAAATDLIAIDTEGIWFLNVQAIDDIGNIAVALGDEIYINKATAVLSKRTDKNAQQRFGYALGTVNAGYTSVVAVKVHWNPDDALELVGSSATPFALGVRPNAREYRYRSTATTGDVRGQYMALGLNGVGGSGEAHRGRTIVEAVGVLTAHGGHHGLEFDTDGTLLGLGVGHRATLMGPNRALMATIAGGMSELFAEGDATNWAAATEHSIHRFVNDGEVTGKATAQNVFSFAGLSATQLQNHNAWVAGLAKVIRVIVDGATYYMGLSNAP